MRLKLKKLLKEYHLDEILEIAGVEEIDALEFLVDQGFIRISDIVEPTDDETS